MLEKSNFTGTREQHQQRLEKTLAKRMSPVGLKKGFLKRALFVQIFSSINLVAVYDCTLCTDPFWFWEYGYNFVIQLRCWISNLDPDYGFMPIYYYIHSTDL